MLKPTDGELHRICSVEEHYPAPTVKAFVKSRRMTPAEAPDITTQIGHLLEAQVELG
ncbi:uncharacterized protein PHALS_08038 [Plasmopara halstedii]|uniref:Uncharacterized protein n=1 Tax=Plasmopara halstedii TaxID=4781 RepID=A0A0P1B8P1_PLAHL|nr:uncharacterized protein PHALS_08038 [Plasmopara halstedii]CEG50319.1 hypothetical protein PHALS_08038 [Plasmopara halstedii]|eukprot:XP_024586688.1 hypothetical protein PHALS_08038 [Plasmopara halstedii]